MAKAIFRWLRGELNGFYLTAIHNTLNEYTKETKQFLVDFGNAQFKKDKIRDQDLYGLGKFAGVFLPRMPVSETKSSFILSDSHIENGVEYSERGLKNIEDSSFDYVHTSPDQTEDINTLATETKRSSLVGNEEVKGYIPYNATDVLDDDGNVRPSKISTTVPDVPYVEFYGNQFTFLSEGSIDFQKVSASLFFDLYKTLQWVRYNGDSITSLCKIASLLCPEGLVKIGDIEVGTSKHNLIVHYLYDITVDVNLVQQRLALFQYVVATKFPQIELVEDTI